MITPIESSGPGRQDEALLVRVPSSLEYVEETIAMVYEHCLACGVAEHVASFRVRVVLSEALGNAIMYGNAMNPEKYVLVRVDVRETVVMLQVEDEGQGFDPSLVPDPTTPERIEEIDGRGIFLIRKLVDDISFNERGNAICMTLRHA